MVKPELGTKRICVNCAARFYDLGRQPAVCPKCETEQPVEQPRTRRPSGNVVEDKRPKKVAPVEAEAEAEVADDEAEEDVLDDAAELDDDDDDDDTDAIVEVEADTDEPER